MDYYVGNHGLIEVIIYEQNVCVYVESIILSQKFVFYTICGWLFRNE